MVTLAWGAPSVNNYKPILLKNVKTLRFFAGQYALNTRDNQPIPQLECAYNPLNDPSALPTAVTCHNSGVDYSGAVVWKCKAKMADTLEFDNLQVSCEGYSRPGDEYVKEGSCALRYTLKIVSAQDQQTPNDNARHHHYTRAAADEAREYNNRQNHYHNNVEVASGWSFTTVLIFVLVVVLIIRCCRKKGGARTNNTTQPVVENSTGDNEPSAPPYSDDSSSFSKRTGYAETVSR